MFSAGRTRTVYRWEPAPQEGVIEAVRQYVRAEKHTVTIREEVAKDVRTEDGIVREEAVRVTAPFTMDFRLGDRIGTEDEMQWEVVEIRTFATNQQMRVVPC